jgi:uroporphyrin-III C-methyltransferase/precorrin-2 dehydrogenase/sirohydrochlorin ferrochelatase
VTVYLVGAGPGDPGLITARGLELVRRCDALVYDTLVAPELVSAAPRESLRISRAGLGQDGVNRLLVALARDGLKTVRLKGGDPFVFGRGSEEAAALAAVGIPVEVVPGVSALASVPAAFDIPVTHRGVSSQVTLVSGHSASGDALDYAQLALTPGTLVFFMGLAHAGGIAAGLVAHGRDPATPAAVISRGTLPDQRLAAGRLADLASLSRGLPSPALIVVGDVVAVRWMLSQHAHAA